MKTFDRASIDSFVMCLCCWCAALCYSANDYREFWFPTFGARRQHNASRRKKLNGLSTHSNVCLRAPYRDDGTRLWLCVRYQTIEQVRPLCDYRIIAVWSAMQSDVPIWDVWLVIGCIHQRKATGIAVLILSSVLYPHSFHSERSSYRMQQQIVNNSIRGRWRGDLLKLVPAKTLLWEQYAPTAIIACTNNGLIMHWRWA